MNHARLRGHVLPACLLSVPDETREEEHLDREPVFKRLEKSRLVDPGVPADTVLVKLSGDSARVFEPARYESLCRGCPPAEKNSGIQIAFMIPRRDSDIEIFIKNILDRLKKNDIVVGYAHGAVLIKCPFRLCHESKIRVHVMIELLLAGVFLHRHRCLHNFYFDPRHGPRGRSHEDVQ